GCRSKSSTAWTCWPGLAKTSLPLSSSTIKRSFASSWRWGILRGWHCPTPNLGRSAPIRPWTALLSCLGDFSGYVDRVAYKDRATYEDRIARAVVMIHNSPVLRLMLTNEKRKRHDI